MDNSHDAAISDLAKVANLDVENFAAVLETRFHRQEFYTNAGSHVVTYVRPRPFDRTIGSRPPSTFVTHAAERVYRTMLAEQSTQFVVLTGESGSGKTQHARQIVDIIARQSIDARAERVADLLVHAEAIYTAFACADDGRLSLNSSRAFRSVNLNFTRDGALVSAVVDVFGVESRRVVTRPPHERNFNIFHQLLAGASSDELSRLHLLGLPLRYTQHTPRAISGSLLLVSDELVSQLRAPTSFLALLPADVLRTTLAFYSPETEAYARTDAALATFLTPAEVKDVYAVLAAILLLGDCEFVEVHDQAQLQSVPLVDFIASLLQVDAKELATALITRILSLRTETYSIPLTKQQAEESRDLLATLLYDHLCSWLFARVNTAISYSGESYAASVTVLDFPGFRSAASDQLSLLHLLSNYIGDHLEYMLQDATLDHSQGRGIMEGLGKLNPQLPSKENVARQRAQAVFVIVDNECRLPKGSESSIYVKLLALPFISPCPEQPHCFIFPHSTATVRYCVRGWMEQNGIRVAHLGLQSCVGASPMAAVASVKARSVHTLSHVTAVSRKLIAMIGVLPDAPCPFVIRCLLPNRDNQSTQFDASEVRRQIEATGMDRTLRVRRDGFTVCPLYTDCLALAARLAPSLPVHTGPPGEAVHALLTALNFEDTRARFGRTRIFLTAADYEQLITLLQQQEPTGHRGQ